MYGPSTSWRSGAIWQTIAVPSQPIGYASIMASLTPRRRRLALPAR